MSKKPQTSQLPLDVQAQLATFRLFLAEIGGPPPRPGEDASEAFKERARNLSPGVRAWALGLDE